MTSFDVRIDSMNCLSLAQEIVKSLTGKTFNILIETKDIGQDAILSKICKRKLIGTHMIATGTWIEDKIQVSIPLSPGGGIAWDLNTEIVDIRFEENGDIWLKRTFKATQKYKMMTITLNPI